METIKKGLDKKGISYKEDIDINKEPMIFILDNIDIAMRYIYRYYSNKYNIKYDYGTDNLIIYSK